MLISDPAMSDDPEDNERLRDTIDSCDDVSGELLQRVYSELHAVADRLMNGERVHHTLQPTALVHEAFLRIGAGQEMDRLSYLAMAAQVMRRVLIDHARGRNAQKRGGAWSRVTLQGLREESPDSEEVDVLRLDQALAELAELDPRQARIVELRFFSGMSGSEIAEHLGVSRNTVVRELTVSRAWLQRALSRGD